MPVRKPPTEKEIANHPVVDQATWLAARRELLEEEKKLTRTYDQLCEKRRGLPWVAVRKEYTFATPKGTQTLGELFQGRSQLILYHFMLGPGWQEGCSGCSFLSDHFDGSNLHLPHHDVTLMAISRAPLTKILKFKERMGWKFPWVSSNGSDFNYDFHASTPPGSEKCFYNFEEIDAGDAGEEHHGISVFFRYNAGEIFHTYSAYARGVDILCGTHNLLDLTPRGRNEHGTMDWVRLHDLYDDGNSPGSCCHS